MTTQELWLSSCAFFGGLLGLALVIAALVSAAKQANEETDGVE